MDKFAEDVLQHKVEQFILLAGRNLGVDNLVKYNKAAKEFTKKNKVFNAQAFCYLNLLKYVNHYAIEKYRINLQEGNRGLRKMRQIRNPLG